MEALLTPAEESSGKERDDLIKLKPSSVYLLCFTHTSTSYSLSEDLAKPNVLLNLHQPHLITGTASI